MKYILHLIIILLFSSNSLAQLPVNTEIELRKVILEEFTGIYCSYCPVGHKIIKQLVDSNPGKVLPISIHTGGFAEPNSVLDPNYTTVFGDSIGILCNVSSFPSGLINREFLPGLGSTSDPTVVSYTSWAFVLPQILDDTAYVNIALEATVDVTTRELELDVEMYFTGNAPGEVNLNIALLQNNVNGPQVNAYTGNPDLVQYDGSYLHNHMLRHLLTGQWGETIDSTDAGTTISRHYSYTIPQSYKGVDFELANIEIIGFVNEGKKDIINGSYAEVNFEGLLSNNATINDIVMLENHCGDELEEVVVYFRNDGENDLTDLKFEYKATGKPIQERIWQGQLEFNQSDSIQLHGIDVSGIETGLLEVEISVVNQGADGDISGNTMTRDVKHISNSTNETELIFFLIQDKLGVETTWEIIDNTTGNIMYTGGPYNVIPNGSPLDTHEISVSLDHQGCHTINVYDSKFNGMNSYWGAGGYRLETLDGDLILESDGIFRDVQTQYFYAGNIDIGIEEFENNIKIFPNPAENLISISSDMEEIEGVSIFNLNGQRVYKANNLEFQNHDIDVSFLSTGIYLVSIQLEYGSSFKRLIVR